LDDAESMLVTAKKSSIAQHFAGMRERSAADGLAFHLALQPALEQIGRRSSAVRQAKLHVQ
jgi:hypothetical protein